MTYLWQRGEPIAALSDNQGRPLSFEWRGWLHPITAVCKRWRVHEGWWRWEIWREYYKVETGTGLLCVIYRDLLSGQWYLQRVYD